MASNDPNPSPATGKIPIDGKEYSVEELQEAMRGGLRQADYTKKTQEVAEERRALEEMRAEFEERLASVQPAKAATEDDDPWAQRFTRLESQISTVTKALSARQEAEAAEREMQNRMGEIEQNLTALSIKPGYNRNEILQTMRQYGMDRPDQVEAAYRIVAGPKIGQSLGEKLAISRGAVEPPVMGGNGIAMATPFSTPNEAAPSLDPSKMSWEDLRDTALRDKDRPR